jgi:protein O-mannosyl-transferase
MSNSRIIYKRKSTKSRMENVIIGKHPSFYPGQGWMIITCLILTLIAYLPVFNAGFLLWDDPFYVENNVFVTTFTGFRQLFLEPVQGNYHPLTILSLAFNHLLSGMNPLSYHLTNLAFHMANVLLVFFLIRERAHGKTLIAFLAALLSGYIPCMLNRWPGSRREKMFCIPSFFSWASSPIQNILFHIKFII